MSAGWGGARTGAGRKPKTLAELVRDGTFRPDRHRGLLLTDGSLAAASPEEVGVSRHDWAALVRWQALYREKGSTDTPHLFGLLVRKIRAEREQGWQR